MGTIVGFLSSSVERERSVIECRLPNLNDTGQKAGKATKALHRPTTFDARRMGPARHHAQTDAMNDGHCHRYTPSIHLEPGDLS